MKYDKIINRRTSRITSLLWKSPLYETFHLLFKLYLTGSIANTNTIPIHFLSNMIFKVYFPWFHPLTISNPVSVSSIYSNSIPVPDTLPNPGSIHEYFQHLLKKTNIIKLIKLLKKLDQSILVWISQCYD